MDDVHFGVKWGDAIHVVPEEGDGGCAEGTPLWADDEATWIQVSKDSAKVVQVLLEEAAGDEDVVKVTDGER